MSHRSTRQVVEDLRRGGRLIQVDEPISPFLEMAEIQRRVYARGGPAILFTNPVGTSFPMVCNLFGSLDQARYIFRRTIDGVRRAIELKIDPAQALRTPWKYSSAPLIGLRMLPRRVRNGAVHEETSRLSQLPKLVSWPDDGGPFITLPQVLSAAPSSRPVSLLRDVNLGMYRVQLSGNDYQTDAQVGLHYQIHRGIGIHHQAALALNKSLPVSITIGGSPAMSLAAVMPLPEGMSELGFAGALAGHRIPMIVKPNAAPIYADADFAIEGTIDPNDLKPEGPFGDHLGYYAKQHDFPFVHVTRVSHRKNAVWPFTVVGRPPQEDTTFGELIHELTGPVVPTVLPGVRAVHAVDAAGVHPLLLAIGSERYTPYRNPNRPQELLTQANAILGQGQMSLAKYLWIVNEFDNPSLPIHDIAEYLKHALERVDWRRDLHFQTETTIDTLDYSGSGFNVGSKVVIAAAGPPRRVLASTIPTDLTLPPSIQAAKVCQPGVLAIQCTGADNRCPTAMEIVDLLERITFFQPVRDSAFDSRPSFPLLVLVDDVEFASRTLNNFLWTAFTRSNPASDIDGLFRFTKHKHWGCEGPLLIDARVKAHHAPPLIEDPNITAKVDALAARGGPLGRYL